MRLQQLAVAALVGVLLLGTAANADVLIYDGVAAGGGAPGTGQYQTQPASTDGTDNNSLIGQSPAAIGFSDAVAWTSASQWAANVYPSATDGGLAYTGLASIAGGAQIARDGSSGTSSSTGKSVQRATTITGSMGSGVYVSALLNFVEGVPGTVQFIQGTSSPRALLIGFNDAGNAVIGTGDINSMPSKATATVYAAGTTHLLVGRFYTDGTDKLQLWVDPVLDGSVPTPTLSFSSDSPGFVANNASYPISAIQLWSQTGNNISNPAVMFDEIRLGQSFADVTPVPEPATMALLGLGGLFAARRRR